MRTYENKDELKNEINKSFAKYISEFNDIPEHLKDKRIDEVDRTPAENLAYQVGWTTLVIKWESDERKGIPVKTPSDNFKWNQLVMNFNCHIYKLLLQHLQIYCQKSVFFLIRETPEHVWLISANVGAKACRYGS